MGTGSYFLFINATPWPFHLLKQHEYQMSTWNFPSVVDTGTAVRVYMEEQFEFFKLFTGSNDGAEAYYTINNSNFEFEILYRASSEPEPLSVSFTNGFHTLNNPTGTTLTLRWTQSQNAPFILASSDTDLATATIVGQNAFEDWMHSIYDRIECLSLRELAIPGAHDAGMSVFDGGVGGASETNTVTQKLSIGDQLKYGARWFDVRPVLAGGVWKTGHYDWNDFLGYWLGGNGQKIDDIVSQINNFTNWNNELVIISLSHGLDTDNFSGDKYNHLTQDNWNDLIDKLLNINHRVTGLSSSIDLSTMLVSDFVNNKPAVIIIIDDQIEGGANVEFSTMVSSGFFPPKQLPLYSSYADTDDLDTMANDQLTKMLNHRPSPQSKMFALSWTLTQNIGDILNPVFASIIDLAAKANVAIYESLWDNMSSESYPNLVEVDGFEANGDLVALVMAINFHFAGRCVPASTGKKTSMGNAILSVGGGSLI